MDEIMQKRAKELFTDYVDYVSDISKYGIDRRDYIPPKDITYKWLITQLHIIYHRCQINLICNDDQDFDMLTINHLTMISIFDSMQ